MTSFFFQFERVVILLIILSPSVSRISIIISRPTITKNVIIESTNEEYGFPTAAPPKVKEIAEIKATVMLLKIPMFFE